MVASEWTKARSVRSTWFTLLSTAVIVIGAGALIAAGVASHYYRGTPADRAGFDPTRASFYSLDFGQLALAVLAILLVSSEYSSGLIHTSLRAVPRRSWLLAAKALVFTAIAVVTGEAVSFACFLSAQAVFKAHGVPYSTLGQPDVLRAVTGAGLYLAATGLGALAVAALIAPLTWRRRHPIGVFAIVWAAAIGLLLSDRELVVADLAVLVALYTVATRCPPRIASVAAIATELGVVVLVSAGGEAGRDWGLKLPYLSAMVAATVLLGANVRVRRAYLCALADRAAALEHQADQQARIAVAAERASIAREMHDIVAHSLAVMITLADAAARKGRSDPDRAVAAMRQVSDTGRQALGETRRLLGVLRTEVPAADDFTPQPGLSRLEPLLDQIRGTGLKAELTVSGQPLSLPDGAQLAAYRIVQEALTNIIKHARGATGVEIRLRYAQPAIEIEISDDGCPRPSRPGERPARSPGHGLIGMKERAGLYNGTVVAGPRPDRGWAVTARLNLAARP